jgi:hypothetical protein
MIMSRCGCNDIADPEEARRAHQRWVRERARQFRSEFFEKPAIAREQDRRMGRTDRRTAKEGE